MTPATGIGPSSEAAAEAAIDAATRALSLPTLRAEAAALADAAARDGASQRAFVADLLTRSRGPPDPPTRTPPQGSALPQDQEVGRLDFAAAPAIPGRQRRRAGRRRLDHPRRARRTDR